jgi:LuxR family maltose regulon positive regulatory protein
MVDRQRLYDTLDKATEGPVTLLSAPPGWGKTALLSSWIRVLGGDRRPVWLTLEPGDAGEVFWSYVRAALNAAGVVVPAPDDNPVHGHDRYPNHLTQLADALATARRPVVLVLDDFHVVRDQRVLDEVDFLVRHSAQQLRLVLSSRLDPALPLHRWRVSGTLTELRTAELSFTEAETATLLANVHPLDNSQLAELHARTEGWPAGLRLVALALPGNPDRDQFVDHVTRADGMIADYLHREVLCGLDGRVRDVLVRASILDTLCAPLIHALTGFADAQQIMADLHDLNGLVVQPAGPPGWFRCHRLLGELLLAELHRQHPGAIAELHRRAAGWYASAGHPREALHHALAAEDWSGATAVLNNRWPELMLCRRSGPQRTTTEPPPAAALRGEPELALAFAADRLNVGDADGAHPFLRLDEQVCRTLDVDRRQRLGLMAAAFRLVEAQQLGETGLVPALVSQLLAGLDNPDQSGRADEELRAIALCALGVLQLSLGQFDAAEETLSNGLVAAEQAGLACQKLLCIAHLARLHAIGGDLQLAERTAQAALSMAACPHRCERVANAHAYLALASVSYQRDHLDDAQRYVELSAHSCAGVADQQLVLGLGMLRTRLLQARGDLVGAYQALLGCRREVMGRYPSSYLEHCLAATEADLRTGHGDTSGARELLEPLLKEAHGVSAALTMALARTYLHDGDPTAATHALQGWMEDRSAYQVLWLRLDAGLLEAQAASGAGDPRLAERALEDVLRLAEPEDCRRIFLQAGAPMRKLLQRHLDSGTAHWSLVSELLDRPVDQRSHAPDNDALLPEPLSCRELAVLRYLQGMLSNSEIAADMCLSVHTVKTHARNIYRKLGVNHRRDAVRAARDLKLL